MVKFIGEFKKDLEHFATESLGNGSLRKKGFLKVPKYEDFAISMDNVAPDEEPGYQIVDSMNIDGRQVYTFQKF